MRLSSVLVPVLLFAACQGTSGGEHDAADAGDQSDGGGGGGSANLLGTIEVVEVHAPNGDAGLVLGTLWESGFAGFHTEVMNDGTCRLLRYEPTFCDPGCGLGLCIDGACTDYPDVDAGTLTVAGPSLEVMVEPARFPFAGYGYWSSLEEPELFAAGDPITASAPGASFPGFEMATVGVGSLELALEADEMVIPNGGDYVFTWPGDTDGASGDRMRLTLNSNNQTHGGPNLAIIECDAEASAGQVAIPRAMIEDFPATEHWDGCVGGDCPLSRALRYRRDTAPVADGEVELLVGSAVYFYLVHRAP